MSDEMEPDGRTRNGLFAAGNKIAKGNPNNRRMSELRGTLLKAVDQEKLVQAFEKLQDLAVAGDLVAMNIYLSYAIGKPTASVEVTGRDGEPLGSGGELQATILAALARFPDARLAVAAELRMARDMGSDR